MALQTGQIVLDTFTGKQVVVVADYGDRCIVSSLKALGENPTLLDRAQWQVPREDLTTAAVQ